MLVNGGHVLLCGAEVETHPQQHKMDRVLLQNQQGADVFIHQTRVLVEWKKAKTLHTCSRQNISALQTKGLADIPKELCNTVV